MTYSTECDTHYLERGKQLWKKIAENYLFIFIWKYFNNKLDIST